MGKEIAVVRKKETKRKKSVHQFAPEGWMTNKALSKALKKSKESIKQIANTFRSNNPKWFNAYLDKIGRLRTYYSPELVLLIKQEATKHEQAPEGWMTNWHLAQKLKKSKESIKQIANTFRSNNPEWFNAYLNKVGKLHMHYSPELVLLIKQESTKHEQAPEGWMTNWYLAQKLKKDTGTIIRIANTFRSNNPKWFNAYLDKMRKLRTHYSPELIQEIEKLCIKTRIEKTEREKAQDECINFVREITQGETVDAQEFGKLISIFGASRVVDILLRFKKEYASQGVSVDYVKSCISDFLGEFLLLKRGFTLDDLNVAPQYLSSQNLREGLTEVMKDYYLTFYNTAKKSGDNRDDMEIFNSCFKDLRMKAMEIKDINLDAVIEDVQNYYYSVFHDLKKPDFIVNCLKDDRLFPDINQLINIKELCDKKRLLIADEMGLGKSASVILAKECLPLKQALIIAPNNVVQVWKRFLSDEVSDDGEQIGYFQKGHAPKVLIVTNLNSFQGVSLSSYDYVIVSQEKLKNGYGERLKKLDYDMLVVDEKHKLKNIKGVRSQVLVELAKKIKGDNKYLVLLSGTPIPNKIKDLAIYLKLLYPEKFENLDDMNLVNNIIYGDLVDLRSLLMSRTQMKKLTESIKMPALNENIFYLHLSSVERAIYEVLIEDDELTATQKIQILRQFLLNPEILKITPPTEPAKIKAVGESLRHDFQMKDKIVMFVNGYIEDVMRGEKSIIPKLKLPNDVEVRTIHGDDSQMLREGAQDEFSNDTQRKILLIISGTTADVGIDLSASESVYFYNEPWTKYDYRQQLARVYRERLEHDLDCKVFIVRNTLEEGIHYYINVKERAIEKLLRGIPIADYEKELLKQDEKQMDQNLEINPELAKYYFSSWDNMMKIFSHVKQIGEKDFQKFLSEYAENYANCYQEIGSRSYQGNASRILSTMIGKMIGSNSSGSVKILDIASGPEMLKKHFADRHKEKVFSIDINPFHFGSNNGNKKVVGSFSALPYHGQAFNYSNLSLALHYTKFVPSKDEFERMEVLYEMNRVLKIKDKALINLLYTFDLKNEKKFRGIVKVLGFKIVNKYSGNISAGENYRSRLITLEKTKNISLDFKEIIKQIDRNSFDGLKFQNVNKTLKNSRMIISKFAFNGKKVKVDFNQNDSKTLKKQEEVIKRGGELRKKYSTLENIPCEEIKNHNFTRMFYKNKYILFKKLRAGEGSVVIK